MRFAVIAHRLTDTNAALANVHVAGMESIVLSPKEALRVLRPGDIALARLDVRPSLDGVERGLRSLNRLSAKGVRVLNPPSALIGAHDKLMTAARLRRAGIPHPRTRYVPPGATARMAPPAVVKPRFGSWGRDVVLCETWSALDARLRELQLRSWFKLSGALLQELVPPAGYDFRVLVAGGEVVGGVRRIAAPGEWRTNIGLGGRRERIAPDARSSFLALEAARAVGGDLVGVDLLPLAGGDYVVLEVNGAVDFTHDYAPGGLVYERAVHALTRSALLRGLVAATVA